MATISGRVIFDRDRSLTVSTGDSGIAGIPVVLQNTATGVRLTVLTDANGNYSFINVPNGNYRIVEAYGTPGGVASPGILRMHRRAAYLWEQIRRLAP